MALLIITKVTLVIYIVSVLPNTNVSYKTLPNKNDHIKSWIQVLSYIATINCSPIISHITNFINFTTMFKITKQTINSSKTIISSKEQSIDCSSFELKYSIIPRLHNLVAVENKEHSLKQTRLRVQYTIECIKAYNCTEYKNYIDSAIKEKVDSINNYISYINGAARVSNRKNMKNNDNLVQIITIEDFNNLKRDLELDIDDKIIID